MEAGRLLPRLGQGLARLRQGSGPNPKPPEGRQGLYGLLLLERLSEEPLCLLQVALPVQENLGELSLDAPAALLCLLGLLQEPLSRLETRGTGLGVVSQQGGHAQQTGLAGQVQRVLRREAERFVEAGLGVVPGLGSHAGVQLAEHSVRVRHHRLELLGLLEDPNRVFDTVLEHVEATETTVKATVRREGCDAALERVGDLCAALATPEAVGVRVEDLGNRSEPGGLFEEPRDVGVPTLLEQSQLCIQNQELRTRRVGLLRLGEAHPRDVETGVLPAPHDLPDARDHGVVVWVRQPKGVATPPGHDHVAIAFLCSSEALEQRPFLLQLPCAHQEVAPQVLEHPEVRDLPHGEHPREKGVEVVPATVSAIGRLVKQTVRQQLEAQRPCNAQRLEIFRPARAGEVSNRRKRLALFVGGLLQALLELLAKRCKVLERLGLEVPRTLRDRLDVCRLANGDREGPRRQGVAVNPVVDGAKVVSRELGAVVDREQLVQLLALQPAHGEHPHVGRLALAVEHRNKAGDEDELQGEWTREEGREDGLETAVSPEAAVSVRQQRLQSVDDHGLALQGLPRADLGDEARQGIRSGSLLGDQRVVQALISRHLRHHGEAAHEGVHAATVDEGELGCHLELRGAEGALHEPAPADPRGTGDKNGSAVFPEECLERLRLFLAAHDQGPRCPSLRGCGSRRGRGGRGALEELQGRRGGGRRRRRCGSTSGQQTEKVCCALLVVIELQQPHPHGKGEGVEGPCHHDETRLVGSCLDEALQLGKPAAIDACVHFDEDHDSASL